MKTLRTLKAYIAFGIISLFFVAGCNKLDSDGVELNKPLKNRGTISETYVYDGNTYVLNFDENDTTGIPINTETESQLIAALGDIEYGVAYYSDAPNIGVLDVGNGGDFVLDTNDFFPAPCFFAIFYEQEDYQGESFCYDSYWTDHEALLEQNAICSEFFGIPNLQSKPFPGGGNWNDKISSFEILRDGATRQFYLDNGYYGSNTGILFRIHRDSDYAGGKCKRRDWILKEPLNGTTESWKVPNLDKEKWRGLWCAHMNNKISSMSIAPCKCAYAGCLQRG